MVFITEDTWRKNGVDVIIIDNIKGLNETHIKEQLCVIQDYQIPQYNILNT